MLFPQQNIRFLGFIYNTKKLTISLPGDKYEAIQKMIVSLWKKKKCIIKDFVKLIGKLVAAYPSTKYGFVHIKPFEKIKHFFFEGRPSQL